MDQIPLGTAIAALRKELKTAISERDEELEFEIRDLELELTVEAASTHSDDLRVTAWFLSLNNKAGRGDTIRHRLKLTLAPLVLDGNGGKVAARMSASSPAPPQRTVIRPDESRD